MSKLMNKINEFMDDLYEHSGKWSWKDVLIKENLFSETPGQKDVIHKKLDISGEGLDIPAIDNKVWGTPGIRKSAKKNKKIGYENPLKGYPYNNGVNK